MATKRKKTGAASKLAHLEGRVTDLEHDVHMLRNGVTHLTTEMTLLKAAVKQVDERTLRGENLLMEMQGEQRRLLKAQGEMHKTLDQIASRILGQSEKPTEG